MMFCRYIDHGKGLLTLRIIQPTIKDSGRYMCKVTSVAGSCLTSSVVRIVPNSQNQCGKRAPMILMAPDDVTASTGSVVSFTVRVTDEVSDLKWLICGREVTNSDRGILVSFFIENFKTKKVVFSIKTQKYSMH